MSDKAPAASGTTTADEPLNLVEDIGKPEAIDIAGTVGYVDGTDYDATQFPFMTVSAGVLFTLAEHIRECEDINRTDPVRVSLPLLKEFEDGGADRGLGVSTMNGDHVALACPYLPGDAPGRKEYQEETDA